MEETFVRGGKTMRRFRYSAIVAVVLGTAACGYFQAGTWEDDPKNWYRAFGEKKPSEVELKHSVYTRMPHFTHEHIFYLEFSAPEPFLDEMIERFGLIRQDDAKREKALRRALNPPEWFLGEVEAEYEVWVGTGAIGNARLFIAKDSRVSYFSHVQL